MLRRWFFFLCMLCMVVPGAPPGMAAQTNILRIQPHYRGQPVSGGTVVICPVGLPTGEGVCLTDGLADWNISREDLLSGNWASWLAGKPLEGEEYAVKPEGAVLYNLSPGIYLIKQGEPPAGYEPFAPLLLTLPAGENREVFCAPELTGGGENPKTGDHPAPIIGAMGIGLSVVLLMVLADRRKK